MRVVTRDGPGVLTVRCSSVPSLCPCCCVPVAVVSRRKKSPGVAPATAVAVPVAVMHHGYDAPPGPPGPTRSSLPVRAAPTSAAQRMSDAPRASPPAPALVAPQPMRPVLAGTRTGSCERAFGFVCMRRRACRHCRAPLCLPVTRHVHDNQARSHLVSLMCLSAGPGSPLAVPKPKPVPAVLGWPGYVSQ